MEGGSARRSSLKGRDDRQSDGHWKDTFNGCGLELEVGGLAALQVHLYIMKCLETIHETFFCLLSLSHLFNKCACVSAC